VSDARTGNPYRFEYRPPTLRAGSDATAALGEELGAAGAERALVVTGSSVGANNAVMDPVRTGLGDRLAGVFDGTSSEKRLSTAFDALDALEEHDADALVGVGGGSSLDLATVTAVLAAREGGREGAAAEFADSGTVVAPPDADLPVLAAVPTTLAGADVSQVAGVNAAPEGGLVEERVGGGVSDPRLMPDVVVHDPDLVATTPPPVLAGSAMNGFDKGLETLYAAAATPVTDATAARGVELFAEGLRTWGETGPTTAALEPIVEALALVQYGVSRPDAGTLGLVHAFGHGLTAGYDVQQGAAHAVVAPHALAYLFEQVDGRRALLADALGVADADDHAAAVVEAVADLRDALGLPSRLRDVRGPDPDEFEAVAEYTLDDSFMDNMPEEFEPTVEGLVGVLEEAH
jgi:alcohol dehydrogenase class IV